MKILNLHISEYKNKMTVEYNSFEKKNMSENKNRGDISDCQQNLLDSNQFLFEDSFLRTVLVSFFE